MNMGSIADKIIGKLKREYVDIENREDITDDEKVTQIINITASICAGLALQPIPFQDTYILTPIQAFMGTRIAAIRGIPVSRNDAITTVKELGGAVGLGLIAQQLVIGAYKTGLPGLGGFMTLPLVFGMTYGIGRVMDYYFIQKARGELIDKNTLKKIWKAGKSEGKSSSDKKKAKSFAKDIAKDEPVITFIKTNFDEAMIVASFLSIQEGYGDTEVDEVVLAAFQRYSDDTQDFESVQNYLSEFDEDSISGVVSNVKGILHEMEFVRMENSDGDSITAAMFPETNHKGYDVVMSDSSTGESWEVQLKTTNRQDYVESWVEEYPDGEILLSSEIADELGMETTGFSNEELTDRVENFVDEIISRGTNSSIWDLFPTLSLMSVSLILVELFSRYQSGEISDEEFKDMAVKATGLKVAKIGILMGVMCIPVVNVAVGAALVARILYSLTSSSKLPPIIKTQSTVSKKLYLTQMSNIK